jgi:hypothetical protein
VLDVEGVFPVARPWLARFDSVGSALLALVVASKRVHSGRATLRADDSLPAMTPGLAMGNHVGLSTWHDIDWRFLLADPHLGRVWLAPDCAAEAAVLHAIGIEASTTLEAPIDAAFVDGRSLDLEALEHSLPKGTLVRIAIASDSLRSPWPSRRPWTARSRALQARGWKIETAAWAAPNRRRPRAYAEVSDRLAVRRLLLLAPAGPAGIARARLALVLTRVGLLQIICREGVILARTPS